MTSAANAAAKRARTFAADEPARRPRLPRFAEVHPATPGPRRLSASAARLAPRTHLCGRSEAVTAAVPDTVGSDETAGASASSRATAAPGRDPRHEGRSRRPANDSASAAAAPLDVHTPCARLDQPVPLASNTATRRSAASDAAQPEAANSSRSATSTHNSGIRPRHCIMRPSPPAMRSTGGASSGPKRRAATRHLSGRVTSTGSTRGRKGDISSAAMGCILPQRPGGDAAVATPVPFAPVVMPPWPRRCFSCPQRAGPLVALPP